MDVHKQQGQISESESLLQVVLPFVEACEKYALSDTRRGPVLDAICEMGRNLATRNVDEAVRFFDSLQKAFPVDSLEGNTFQYAAGDDDCCLDKDRVSYYTMNVFQHRLFAAPEGSAEEAEEIDNVTRGFSRWAEKDPAATIMAITVFCYQARENKREKALASGTMSMVSAAQAQIDKIDTKGLECLYLELEEPAQALLHAAKFFTKEGTPERLAAMDAWTKLVYTWDRHDHDDAVDYVKNDILRDEAFGDDLKTITANVEDTLSPKRTKGPGRCWQVVARILGRGEG